jgi:hypothetical protein
MLGKVVISQIFAIPTAWASTAALTAMFGNLPWYIPVGIWGFVSLFVLAELK